jgi:hypothetical protein
MNTIDREILEHRFRVCIDSRNFEVSQLANRNNFFMIFQGVLLSGLVQVSDKASGVVAFYVCLVGVLMSALQFGMASGAKFWQERWEHDLEAVEREWMLAASSSPGRTVDVNALFSMPLAQAEKIVSDRLSARSALPDSVVHRFSVSRIPIYAAAFLLLCWIGLLCTTMEFCPSNPLPWKIVGFKGSK